jgi:hypothetical protein
VYRTVQTHVAGYCIAPCIPTDWKNIQPNSIAPCIPTHCKNIQPNFVAAYEILTKEAICSSYKITQGHNTEWYNMVDHRCDTNTSQTTLLCWMHCCSVTLLSQLNVPWRDVYQDLHSEAMAQQWSARQASRVTLWRHLMQQPCINTTEYYFLIWWLLISIHPVAIGSFVSYGCLFVNKYFKIPFIDSLNCMQMTCVLFVYTRFVQATPVTWMDHMLLWSPLPNILLFSFKCLVDNTLSCKYYSVLVTAEWNISMEHWQHDTERGKLKNSREKPVPMLLWPP